MTHCSLFRSGRIYCTASCMFVNTNATNFQGKLYIHVQSAMTKILSTERSVGKQKVWVRQTKHIFVLETNSVLVQTSARFNNLMAGRRQAAPVLPAYAWETWCIRNLIDACSNKTWIASARSSIQLSRQAQETWNMWPHHRDLKNEHKFLRSRGEQRLFLKHHMANRRKSRRKMTPHLLLSAFLTSLERDSSAKIWNALSTDNWAWHIMLLRETPVKSCILCFAPRHLKCLISPVSISNWTPQTK